MQYYLERMRCRVVLPRGGGGSLVMPGSVARVTVIPLLFFFLPRLKFFFDYFSDSNNSNALCSITTLLYAGLLVSSPLRL